jgi:dihydrodipicolinate synthase/N-acetylneuraminate lyase
VRPAEFFKALLPFMRIAVVLGLFLAVAALLTLRGIARSRRMPAMPLIIDEQAAARASMNPADLTAAPEVCVVLVHVDPDGCPRIVPC